MNKKLLVIGAALFLLTLGAGCRSQVPKNGSKKIDNVEQQAKKSPEELDDADQVFEDLSTRVSFHYMGYLQKSEVRVTTGSVYIVFKRREGSTRPIDTLIFSAKTKDAYLAENLNAPKGTVCEDYTLPGCDKWEDDLKLYNHAMSQNAYDGYYGFGGSRVTLNGITYVSVVDYNAERQQYRTRYIAFINNTRITFTDPATGGLEYGVPFQMNARNREMIEKTGQKLAKREKIDDTQTYTRSQAFFQIVSTLKLIR